MKAQIIQIDTHETNSGILYSTEEITKAIDALQTNSGYGVLDVPKYFDRLDIEKVCLFWDNMRIEDGWLIADIRVSDTPYGNILNYIDYTIKPIMLAKLSANKTASDIKIVGLWVDAENSNRLG